jgi:3-oxoacyl-[acyl-carrier-protein] synthase-3
MNSQIGRNVAIAGTGSYLPERILTNAELERMVDTTDEWIRTRTGMSERHIARDDEASSDMATEAARNAMADAGVTAADLDAIVVGTITPDMPFPSTACVVQQNIGADRAFCFDVVAACSGFIYSMEVARSMIACGSAETVLVISSEKLSCVTDWQDRGTCVLFGDGAGAVVLKPVPGEAGIRSCFMGSDGALGDLLNIPGGGSRRPASHQTVDERLHCIKMTGNEVFKHAVRCMCDAGKRALAKAGIAEEDVDWIIPHQANMRIIKAIASRFGGTMDKFIVNVERVGNISGASIPVALDEAIRDGRVKPGQTILFVAFGGGFTWGAMVVRM